MNKGDLFRFMADEQLMDAIRRLERKVDSLRMAGTAIGVRLHQEFSDALTAARQEAARRSTI